MSWMPHTRRALVALGTFAALTLPVAQLRAQASVNVYLESGLTSCGNPQQGAPSGTPTSMAWVASYSGYGCDLRGSAHSYLGHVGASANVEMFTGDWSSGGHRVRASGSWNDVLKAQVNQSYFAQGARQLAITYNIGTHGIATAHTADLTAAGGNASIGYAYSLGNTNGTGGQSANTYIGGSTFGTWGTIPNTVMVYASQLANGQWEFNGVSLALSGWADVSVGKGYNPGLIGRAGADGDFGSTLQWEGVTDIHAYDANMNEIALGSDADFAFIGQATGFDYQASVVPVTATPEPGSLLLLGTGAVAVALARRRRVS